MPDPERVYDVVRSWIVKAEHDLTNAVHTLKLGEECPTDTVCFHAQQCVEKYIKAYLVFCQTDFPKTHDIKRLLTLLPRGFDTGLDPQDHILLTKYAIAPRYPGWSDIPLPQARHAVALARAVKRAIRKQLPRKTYYRALPGRR